MCAPSGSHVILLMYFINLNLHGAVVDPSSRHIQDIGGLS